MKTGGVLHPQLGRVLAELGHGDLLGIADAGLPLPMTVERVDLALTRGSVSFEQAARAVLGQLCVETIVLAAESRQSCPHLVELLRQLAPAAEIVFVSHAELKERSRTARAIVRTGEFTPFANALLVSGVDFT
jgi:D-ribose pyranase